MSLPGGTQNYLDENLFPVFSVFPGPSSQPFRNFQSLASAKNFLLGALDVSGTKQTVPRPWPVL